MKAGALDRPVTVIAPPARGFEYGLGEMWRHRELLYFLVWRDLTLRYRQTVFGVLWAVLQPLFVMLIFTVVFGRIARMPSDGAPYPVWSFAGLVVWTYFANTVSQCAGSVVGSAHLVTKVYFPRLVIRVASALAALIDMAIAVGLLVVLMTFYGLLPGAGLLALPLLAAFAGVTALGVGVWLAALNVEYRDVRYLVPFLVQGWLFATPVAYPASVLPKHWQAWVAVNPMAGVVEAFRGAVLGTPVTAGSLVISAVVAGVVLISGLIYFQRVEGELADHV